MGMPMVRCANALLGMPRRETSRPGAMLICFHFIATEGKTSRYRYGFSVVFEFVVDAAVSAKTQHVLNGAPLLVMTVSP